MRHLSQGSSRLYEICKAFLNTAQALIDSRQTLTGLEQIDDGSLIMMPGSSGSGGDNRRMSGIVLPDVSWPEDMGQDFNVSSADIEGFLNEFLGAGRPVGDMWSLNCADTTNMS